MISIKRNDLINIQLHIYVSNIPFISSNFIEILIFTGYGGLSLSIEGPSKADIECQDNEDGACRVTYKPTEPGNYIINVKFADEHVPGKHSFLSTGLFSILRRFTIHNWYNIHIIEDLVMTLR